MRKPWSRLGFAGLFGFSGALRWKRGGAYRGLLLIGATTPPFLLALGGIILFYARLDWLPASGQGPDDPGPTEDGTFAWLMRAAGALQEERDRDPHREQLLAHFRAAGNDPYSVMGKYLVGLADERQNWYWKWAARCSHDRTLLTGTPIISAISS